MKWMWERLLSGLLAPPVRRYLVTPRDNPYALRRRLRRRIRRQLRLRMDAGESTV